MASDAPYIASGNRLVNIIKVFNFETKKEEASFQTDEPSNNLYLIYFMIMIMLDLTSIAISDDGKFIISAHAWRSIKVFDVNTKKEKYKIENPQQGSITRHSQFYI